MKRLLNFCFVVLAVAPMAFGQVSVSIAEIQDTTGSGSDASSLNNSIVIVSGVVSAESYAFGSYWIQDGTGPWSGVFVYDPNNDAAYGDRVLITGLVDEYNGLTQVKEISSFEVLSSGNVVEPTLVTSGEIATGGVNAEAYEGVLVKVVNADITDFNDWGEWHVDDGSGAVMLDDEVDYYFDPSKHLAVKSVVGVLTYDWNNHKMYPRLAYDIEEAGETIRIQRLQQVRRSDILAGNDSTYFKDDTIMVSGIVTVPSGLFYAGDGNKYYLQQSGGGPFSGLMVYDYVTSEIGAVFEGDSITIRAVIVEYESGGNTTELDVVEEMQLWGVDHNVTIDDVTTDIFNDSLYFTDETTVMNYEAEKWENALIRVSIVEVAVITDYGVRLDDHTGRGLLASLGYSDGVTMGAPPLGTIFTSVTGTIYDHWGNYNFIPRYDADIVLLVGPPLISNPGTDPALPQPGDAITVSCAIVDDGTVEEAELYYSVNDGAFTSAALVHGAGAGYSVEIGPFANDDSISYYITATDNDAGTSVDPEGAPVDSVYTFVVSGPEEVTIYDIQYNADFGGSAYVDALVEFTGTVTSDSSTNAYNFHVQDFDNTAHTGAAWNGVMVYSSDHNIYEVGTKLSIVASVTEYYGVTEILDVASCVNVGTGTVTAEVVTSGDIASDSTASEPYEGALIQINDVTVTLLLDYDDWEVTDEDGFVVQIGGSDAYDYEPVVGDHIASITGNLTYSHDKYELLVRGEADLGTITVSTDKNPTIPMTYQLNQNYPNPFNPTTTIQYGIPNEGHVSLTIYNIMGQEIKTLVNTNQDAGFYTLYWNGLNNNNQMVSSGLYIYRIISEDFVKSKKMIYLK
jgi:hypothetical protein